MTDSIFGDLLTINRDQKTLRSDLRRCRTRAQASLPNGYILAHRQAALPEQPYGEARIPYSKETIDDSTGDRSLTGGA